MIKRAASGPFFFGFLVWEMAMLYSLLETRDRGQDRELTESLEPVIRGMGMSLIELSVFMRKGHGADAGTAQVKAVVYRSGITGLEDCSRVHRAILPRLELAFPERDIYLEVSSPGIDRIIKEGREFVNYIGQGVKCYRTDIFDWTAGVVMTVDEKKIVLKGKDGETVLPYEIIAKARLNALAPEGRIQKNKGG